MVRRILVPALAGALSLAGTGCEPKLPPNGKSNGGSADTVAIPTDIGGDLFPAASVPSRPQAPVAAGVATDPIVVPQCQITTPVTQNVPSKNDGQLIAFCTEMAAGEVVPEADLIAHPRTGKKYRRLREGDIVKPGQLIAIMDDRVAWANHEVARTGLEANKAKKVAADKLFVYAEIEWQRNVQAGVGASASETARSRAQMDKSQADIAEAIGQINKSVEELNKAVVQLNEHEIRSTIHGEVKRYYRRPGESVKAFEPVAEIQNTEQMRVEGMIDVQHRTTLARSGQGQGRKVIVERAEQTAHAVSLDGHLSPVLAVAVSKDARKPLIVSASSDKTVRVWERLTATERANFRHDVPVRAVACTPPSADANLCLTGADDGIGRIWDLDNLAAANPLRELKGRHQGQIVSVAFSPHGQFCATADGREVIVWDVASGDMKYRVAQLHRAPITYVQFTPQSKLVTVARDATIRLWKLGEKGAAPEAVMEHRANAVPVLGVSPDGQTVLFDQDKALQLLTLPDQRSEGVLRAASEAATFTTFALFSPDGKLVMAAGSGDSPLQLWKTPAPGERRGTMLRRLAISSGSLPACAAFSPDGTFAVTGTTDNRVLVWGMPDKAELARQLTGTISYLESSIDTADRKVRIWADLNPIAGTKPPAGDTVTLVIPTQETR